MGRAAQVRSSVLADGMFVRLGLLLGLFMPAVSALLYPTWTHEMHPAWVEYTRLMEMPFVFCELSVILWAIRSGMRDAAIWRALAPDVRVALAVLALGLTVGSVFVSRNPAFSIALSVITVIHLRFGAAVYFLTGRNGALDVASFVPLLGVGVGLLAALTAWRIGFPLPAPLVPGGVIEWDSAMPGFISVRHLGSWTGAVAAGLLLLMLYDDDGSATVDPRVRDALYLLAAGFTVWTGTRAAVLSMIVVAFVAAATLRRLPSRRAAKRTIGLTMLAVTLAWLVEFHGSPSFALYVSDDMQTPSTAAAGRLELWAATFQRWTQSPLFGWGSGSTFWEVYIGWAHTQPHNALLQFLISWGLVGTAGAVWLLGRAILATYRHGFTSPELRPLAGVTCSLLFMSLMEGMLHYPRFILVVMLGLAAILADRGRTPTPRAPLLRPRTPRASRPPSRVDARTFASERHPGGISAQANKGIAWRFPAVTSAAVTRRVRALQWRGWVVATPPPCSRSRATRVPSTRSNAACPRSATRWAPRTTIAA